MGGATGGAAAGGTYGESNWKADESYRGGIREFSETGAAAAARGRDEKPARGRDEKAVRGRDEKAVRGTSEESGAVGREPGTEEESEW